MTLSTRRAVRYSDIDPVRVRLELDKEWFRHLLRLNTSAWARITRRTNNKLTCDQPVKEHRLAVLLRWFDEADLDALFLPVRPTQPAHLFDHLKGEIPKLTRRRFALTLGADEGRASKWLQGKTPPHPLSTQLITLVTYTQERPTTENWLHLEHLSQLEAKLRGIPDLFAASSWGPDRSQRGRSTRQIPRS